MDKPLLKKLIESYVNDAFRDSNVFLEAEDELDLGGDEGGDDLGDLDIGGDEGGDIDDGGDLDLDGGGEGGEGGLDGEEGEEDLGDDMGGDLGGGGGGFGGGGGDFGGEDDFGGDEAEDGEGEEGELPDSVALPDDPVQAAVDIATAMLETTGDDNEILSAVKASIQANFEDFSDAAPIITSLWQTEHPILKVVARKLLLFIQGR